jgi:hypothetical protein
VPRSVFLNGRITRSEHVYLASSGAWHNMAWHDGLRERNRCESHNGYSQIRTSHSDWVNTIENFTQRLMGHYNDQNVMSVPSRGSRRSRRSRGRGAQPRTSRAPVPIGTTFRSERVCAQKAGVSYMGWGESPQTHIMGPTDKVKEPRVQ